MIGILHHCPLTTRNTHENVAFPAPINEPNRPPRRRRLTS